MKIKICTPRILGRAIFAGLILLGSTFVLAQTGANPKAATQSRVQLEGELEILHQDYKDGRGHYLYSLKMADGTRVPLQFMKQPPTHLLSGDHVRVSGQLSGGSMVLYSGSTNVRKTTTTSTTTTSST